MAWSKEWINEPSEPLKVIENVWPTEIISLGSNKGLVKPWPNLGNGADKTIITKVTDTHVEFKEFYKVRSNKVPTHDPYTNPNANIYYQCNCGAIFDPGTKSFAQLNNAASNAGWKVRWGATSYVPYCVECGKDVE